MDPSVSVAVSTIAVVLSYLIGSVSFAVLVSRVMGLADPHTYGSGNPGATNVLRTGNKKAALLTLLGDSLKGFVAVTLAQVLSVRLGLAPATVAACALAAFVGHLYPVFHRFQGGKGVATAAGVLFALSLWLGLATVATWGIVAGFLRYSSLAALVAAIFAPLCYVFLFGPDATAFAVLAMSILLVWRHRENIARLLSGRETRIGGRG